MIRKHRRDVVPAEDICAVLDQAYADGWELLQDIRPYPMELDRDLSPSYLLGSTPTRFRVRSPFLEVFFYRDEEDTPCMDKNTHEGDFSIVNRLTLTDEEGREVVVVDSHIEGKEVCHTIQKLPEGWKMHATGPIDPNSEAREMEQNQTQKQHLAIHAPGGEMIVLVEGVTCAGMAFGSYLIRKLSEPAFVQAKAEFREKHSDLGLAILNQSNSYYRSPLKFAAVRSTDGNEVLAIFEGTDLWISAHGPRTVQELSDRQYLRVSAGDFKALRE